MTTIVLGIVVLTVGGFGAYAWNRRRRDNAGGQQSISERRRRED